VEDSNGKAILHSGELARIAGISADTLRHYERVGVLPAPRRSQGNYRLYPAEAVERVRLVRRSLSIGFSLPELAKILRVRAQGEFPCRQVKALLEDKLNRVEQEILELKALHGHLRALLKDWHQRLEQTPQGQPARLLENLPPLPTKGKSNEHSNRHRFSRGGNRAKRAGPA
jgi:DNA-binding transcriptional MerR regulator